MIPLLPGRLAFWSRSDSLYLWEAAALLNGIEPDYDVVKAMRSRFDPLPGSVVDKIWDVIDLAQHSEEAGKANWMRIPRLPPIQALFSITVEPPGFFRWAMEKGFSVPPELQLIAAPAVADEAPAATPDSAPVEEAAKVAGRARAKAKRGGERKDALHSFIDEAVIEWREHRGRAWPLSDDVLKLLRRDYPSGSPCGVIERVTEEGIEWRPPNGLKLNTLDCEALRKRLERMHKKQKRNAEQVRTDDMDACT